MFELEIVPIKNDSDRIIVMHYSFGALVVHSWESIKSVLEQIKIAQDDKCAEDNEFITQQQHANMAGSGAKGQPPVGNNVDDEIPF